MTQFKITIPMIEKLVRFTNLRKLLTGFLTSTAQLELADFKDFSEEEKKDIITGVIKGLEIERHLLPIYQEHFSPEELLDIIAFFRTKSGQQYAAKGQVISDAILATVPTLTVEMTVSLATEIGRRRNP